MSRLNSVDVTGYAEPCEERLFQIIKATEMEIRKIIIFPALMNTVSWYQNCTYYTNVYFTLSGSYIIFYIL